MTKLYWVTERVKLNKKQEKSRVVGFVSVFGWESAEKKAQAKFPGFDISGVHEAQRRRVSVK